MKKLVILFFAVLLFSGYAAAACWVQGYVKDINNVPIEGALINHSEPVYYYGYSDSNGFYTVTTPKSLAGGYFYFKASKSGYVTQEIKMFCYGGTIYNTDFFLTPIYIDCGLRIYNGTAINIIACEPLGTLTSPLRIFNGSNTYCLVLVDTSHSY